MIHEIAIYPLSGAFDPAALQRELLVRPYAARDAYEPETIVESETADSLDRVLVARTTAHASFPRTTTLVSTHPVRIDIAYSGEAIEALRAFVQHVRRHYDVRFEDADHGGDVTAQVDDALTFLFGVPP